MKLSVPVTQKIGSMLCLVGVLFTHIMFLCCMWECMHLICHMIFIWMIWHCFWCLWLSENVLISEILKKLMKKLISYLLKCFVVLLLHFLNKGRPRWPQNWNKGVIDWKKESFILNSQVSKVLFSRVCPSAVVIGFRNGYSFDYGVWNVHPYTPLFLFQS